MQIGDAQDLFYVSFIAGFAFGFGIFYLLNALSLNIDRGAVWGFLARLWPGRSGSGRGRSPGDGTRGFTLIEMAMVILIAGLLIAGVARAMTIWLQWHAKTVTDEAQAEITEALKTFVAENNRLPCAAPIDAPPNSAEFGRESIEACKDYDPVPGIWMAPATNPNPRFNTRGGAVPTRTLNIPDKYAYDGWGNRMTYAVTIQTADITKVPGGFQSGGAIDLVDGADNPVTSPPETGKYVIVSPGRAGNGAYTAHGVRPSACDTATLDGENCDEDSRFRITDYSRAEGPTQFDNIVSYDYQLTGSGGEGVPPGAVVPFNLASCPDGWAPFTEGIGRTFMGMGDYSETYSLPGEFAGGPWTVTKSYALGEQGGYATIKPSHPHQLGMAWDSHYLAQSNPGGYSYETYKADPEDVLDPTENRPPYISLLYCEKS